MLKLASTPFYSDSMHSRKKKKGVVLSQLDVLPYMSSLRNRRLLKYLNSFL